MNKTLKTLLAISISLSTFGHSQGTTNSKAQFKLQFSVYPIGNSKWSEIYYQRKPNLYEKLSFWPFERSPAHDYQGPNPIQFCYQYLDEGGNPHYQVIGEAQLDVSSNRHLLFFVPIPTVESKTQHLYQIAAMNDAPKSFPLDTVTFLNATGANLEGVFGGKPIFLQKGLSTPFEIKRHFTEQVFIGLAIHYEGGFKKVLQNKWQFYPDYREIVILLPPKHPKSFRVQAFRLSQHKTELPRSNSVRESSRMDEEEEEEE
ncbi:MAG: hypothetical protein MI748_04615 [Opitutales bacterium]|nr:hypothetical protein [Opitutales bacterium]